MQQADALHPAHSAPTATADVDGTTVSPLVPESHEAGPAAVAPDPAVPFDNSDDVSLHQLAAVAMSPPRTSQRDPAQEAAHAGNVDVNQPADAAPEPAQALSEGQLGIPAALMVGEQLLALSRVASQDASCGGPPPQIGTQ